MRTAVILIFTSLLIAGCRSANDRPADGDVPADTMASTAPATPSAPEQRRSAGIVPTGDVPGQGLLPDGKTHVFDCAAPDVDSLSVTVRVDSTEAMIWIPTDGATEPVSLERAQSADGARYENEEVMFWNRGEEATLVVDGVRYESCARNNYRSVWEDARLDGIDFRALGNEPGWIVDIHAGDRFDVQWRYGERTATLPYADPETPDDSTTVFQTETADHSLSMTITAGGCTDSMSGISFPAAVTIRIDGSEYTGCGRPLH